MEFAVSREGTTLITLHGGSDTTARDDATEQLAATLERLEDDGTVTAWTVDDAAVYEHPTAPFDPYTITLEFSITVVVEADDADAAAAFGADVIDDTLERADVKSVTYTTAPAASTA
ncbi:hypothetical protein [Natronorubrum sulfidifaciens]|uniref:Uncharacterized protein n=1 Tax=Natronorubrum sulfidifaciens JCM 14089 TaxID=1230460 RepID=L9W4N9_9EURY|nr:hypothetical protein [Natronorubrum sulfidifaciens]ELY44256.1 hypothetical protein C495_10154 [Natronorubrum sulfidifaciens JCM 14089]